MKFRLIGIASLLLARTAFGQLDGPLAFHSLTDPTANKSISLYQLTYKPVKQARKLFEKAVKCMKQQDYEKAQTLLENAIKLDTEDWAINNNLGVVYLKLGKLQSAQKLLERNLQIDPQNSVSYLNLAVCHFNARDYPASAKLTKDALRLNPRFPEAQFLFGLSEVAQGHWSDEAKKMIEQMHEMSPSADKLLRRWPQREVHASKVEASVIQDQ